MKKMNWRLLFLIVSLQLLIGCVAGTTNIVKPTPNFSWEPPNKESSQNLNLALIDPSFAKESRFVFYKKSPYLKTFLDSVHTDLQRTLLAKGFTVTGPYENFEVMTFPNKKDAPLALIPEFVLEIDDCERIMVNLKQELIAKKEAGELFGKENSGRFEGIIKGLYQTFGGKEVYKSIEEKAAHLLYLIIKDHPFLDGNKRIASILFVYFLERNNYSHKKNWERKINDNALTALALLIAISDPKEKETMINIITNLIG